MVMLLYTVVLFLVLVVRSGQTACYEIRKQLVVEITLIASQVRQPFDSHYGT